MNKQSVEFRAGEIQGLKLMLGLLLATEREVVQDHVLKTSVCEADIERQNAEIVGDPDRIARAAGMTAVIAEMQSSLRLLTDGYLFVDGQRPKGYGAVNVSP